MKLVNFRNKKMGYLKDKINDHETNTKNETSRDLYKGINELCKVY